MSKTRPLYFTRTTVVSIVPAVVVIKFCPASPFVCGTVFCAKTKQLLANMTRYFNIWRHNLPPNFHCMTSLQIVSAITGVSEPSLARYQKEFIQNTKISALNKVGSVLPACKQEAVESKKVKVKTVKRTNPSGTAVVTDKVHITTCSMAGNCSQEHSYVRVDGEPKSSVRDVVEEVCNGFTKNSKQSFQLTSSASGDASCESIFFCDEVYTEFEDTVDS